MRGRKADTTVAAPLTFEGSSASIFGSFPEPASAVSGRSRGVSRTSVTRVGKAGAFAATMSLLVVAIVAALAAATPAQADKTVDRFIGGAAGSAEGQFTQPRGVAINESTGDVYVAEGLNAVHRVSRYSREGEFELMWGRGVEDGSPVAQVCTAATTPCQAGGTGTAAGEFSTPVGLAIDQTDGSVYVYDRGNARVQKFGADGDFILMLGRGVNQTTGGDVCTATSGNTCKAGVAGTGAGQFGATTQNSVRGIAVHPISGDLFVSDITNRRIHQFTSGGTFVRAWGWGVDTGAAAFEVCTTASACNAAAAAGTDNGRFGTNNPAHLAVDADGVVYASDSGLNHRVLRFDSDGFGDPSTALLAPILADDQSPPGPLLSGTGSSGTTGLAIDPASGNLLVVRHRPNGGETLIQEIDTATVSEVARHGVGSGLTTVQGLAVDGTRDRLVASYAATPPGHGFFILDEDGPSSPTVMLRPASDVEARSAMLHGTIDPNGFAEYVFEVSTDGGTWEPVGGGTLVGVGDVDVTATANGLAPNTPYRVRLRTTSVIGGDANGPVPTLEVLSLEGNLVTDAIPADVTTVTASSITDTGALLVGRVNPNGSETAYWFEYGETTSYGNRVPVPAALAGSGTTELLVSQQLGGLVPNRTYHYRLAADNGVAHPVDGPGPRYGADRTFTTGSSSPNADAFGDSRAYELVSPADKVGGQGVGSWYNAPVASGRSGHAAYAGERFAVKGSFGSTLLGHGAAAYGNDYVFAERTAAGWRSHSPFTHAVLSGQAYRLIDLSSAADDLSKVTLKNNGGITKFFPEMADWPESTFGSPLMIGDWQGRWEIFGPTDRDTQISSGTTQANVDDAVVSADGSHVVGTSGMRGLAGIGDPSHQLVSGRTVYAHDSSGGLSDSFPGAGVRTLVQACSDETMIPNRLASGKLGEQACPDLPGTDASLVSRLGAALTSDTSSWRSTSKNAVSRDGSRIFFMSPDPLAVPATATNNCAATFFGPPPPFTHPANGANTSCPPQLYMRESQPDGSFETRWISRAEEGLFGQQDASLLGPAQFEGATPDGAKVLFRTNSPLTTDDPNGTGAPAPVGGVKTGTPSGNSWDLYLYDVESDELTRISGGPSGQADCNSPVGGMGVAALRFLAEDGSRAYFTCAAPLDGALESSNGTITAPVGTASTTSDVNLYLYDARRPQPARWRFVARLPRAVATGLHGDLSECASTGVADGTALGEVRSLSFAAGLQSANCVRGTADGAFVTMWTDGRLTADDPDDRSGDIYGYDAERDELTRITRPAADAVGGAYECVNATDSSADVDEPRHCHGDVGFNGGSVKEALPLLGVATHPAAGDRRAFFQSRSRLVAEDTDSNYDVYEWRNGELSLISTGASAGEGAFYRGNDRSGTNVYFATMDALTWEDHDAVMDVYTARVGGGFPEPPRPVVCGVVAGGCHGNGAAAVAVPPAASTAPARVGDAVPDARPRLTVASLGRKARRRAARRGVIALRVRTTTAGRVRAVARGKVGGKRRTLARAARNARSAGRVVVRLRLNRAARRHLRTGRRLRVAVRVDMAGARQRTATVLLRRPGR
ncbi:MAG TPA: hypothetical protein VHF88_05920 [Thermoleophilaceae bacterium]|nr:hypothetical protein [Thermoleophilaceae bacterium]